MNYEHDFVSIILPLVLKLTPFRGIFFFIEEYPNRLYCDSLL